MRKEYIEELEKLKIRMEQAEDFAKKLPMFEETIITDKLTGNEEWINFGKKYKDTYFGWNINRGLYSSNSKRYVSNYKGKDYTEFLFSIYVNCYLIFEQNDNNFGLKEVSEKIPLFFYDSFNTNFYATDEQVYELLESLNDWYVSAIKKNSFYLANKKLEEAIKKFEEAKKEFEEAKKESEDADTILIKFL